MLIDDCIVKYDSLISIGYSVLNTHKQYLLVKEMYQTHKIHSIFKECSEASRKLYWLRYNRQCSMLKTGNTSCMEGRL